MGEQSLYKMYNRLQVDERITAVEKEILENFETVMKTATSQNEVFDIFNEFENHVLSSDDYSQEFKSALSIGFDQAEIAMCAEDLTNVSSSSVDTNDGEISSRCEIIECYWEYEWVLKTIVIVITVVAIILAIFTFGFSLLLVTITATAWVLVPVLVCLTLPCPEEACPDGQTLTCRPMFTLNGDGTMCISEDITMISQGGAMFVDPLPSGDCPPGSIDVGGDCFIGNIDDGNFSGIENWGINSDGNAFHTPICL